MASSPCQCLADLQAVMVIVEMDSLNDERPDGSSVLGAAVFTSEKPRRQAFSPTIAGNITMSAKPP